MTLAIFPRPRTLKLKRQILQRNNRTRIKLNSAHSENFLQALTRFGQRWGLASTYGTPKPEQCLLDLQLNRGNPSEAYKITTTEAGYRLSSNSEEGLFRGLATLDQVLALEILPQVDIEDEPDFKHRGVMLDISRCKVPSLKTLKALIDQFAALKFNQLQLYTEHTFAFINHETVWADASPLTAEETLELKHYAAARYIELVPNLNCFGHFERWLKHPAYHHYAECPDGFIHPLTQQPMPYGSTLNPTKQSLRLIDQLHQEYLPLFDSPYFNVGGDEPWELGLGRSQRRCDAEGTTNVYIDFVSDIQQLVEKRGRQMMFWSDIVLKDPTCLKRLSKHLIALNWGYEGNHPFAQEAQLVAAEGLPFYVCPGTSSWNALTGRSSNMRKNIKSAAKHGKNNGAEGLLVTDWGDHGHHQYLPISYPGFTLAACESWRVGSLKPTELAEATNRFFLQEPNTATARQIIELGEVLELVKSPIRNATVFNQLLFWQMQREPSTTKKLSSEALINCYERLEAFCQQPQSPTPLVAGELTNAALMARHGVARLLYVRGVKGFKGKQALAQLRADMRRIQGQHQLLWQARNRIGGLQESLGHLERAESPLFPH